MRGTFANIRLRNEMAPGTEGPWTTYLPDGDVMTVFDAAGRYREAGVPLAVLAGKEYGSGSSRDWAAKGPSLLGVRFVIAESYERIHRSNLVGMGVLPLQFARGGVGGVARPHRPGDVLGPRSGGRRVTRAAGRGRGGRATTGARARSTRSCGSTARPRWLLRERRPPPDGACESCSTDSRSGPSTLRELSRDLVRPRADRVPVAEVAVGRLHGLHHHALAEPELAAIQRAEEHAMLPRAEALRQLGELSRLLLLVVDLGPQRPAAEQPHRQASTAISALASANSVASFIHDPV